VWEQYNERGDWTWGGALNEYLDKNKQIKGHEERIRGEDKARSLCGEPAKNLKKKRSGTKYQHIADNNTRDSKINVWSRSGVKLVCQSHKVGDLFILHVKTSLMWD